MLALILLACLADPAAAEPPPPPVLLVHGIHDTGGIFAAMGERLRRQGRHVHAFDLTPNDGGVGMAGLAAQLKAQADRIRAQERAPRLDLVGFSMGALVARYYLQRLEGLSEIRRFVSISGPQAGSLLAYFRWNEGGRDLRPGSALLRDLERDADRLSMIPVTSIWTPFDLMIVPAWSSRIPGASEIRLPVLFHPWMVSDPAVIQAVERALD